MHFLLLFSFLTFLSSRCLPPLQSLQCTSLYLSLIDSLPPSSMYKGPFHYNGPTWIIQDNLLRVSLITALIPSATLVSHYVQTDILTGLGFRMLSSLGTIILLSTPLYSTRSGHDAHEPASWKPLPKCQPLCEVLPASPPTWQQPCLCSVPCSIFFIITLITISYFTPVSSSRWIFTYQNVHSMRVKIFVFCL